MITFAAGLIIGLSLGLVVIGFLALGSYERGREAASAQRRHVTKAA